MTKKIKDPGFGLLSSRKAKAYVTDSGISTVIHINKEWNVSDYYFQLIEMKWSKFFGVIILGYILINVIFGSIYMVIGIEEITASTNHWFSDFLNGFFFSAQTITTVGYGGISPHGILANIVSTFEALVGLLSFSFITGLLYGRFSRPNASIRFSQNLVFRDFKDKKALMFRLMNHRTNTMIKPRITVSLGITSADSTGSFKRAYYELPLERESIMALPTIWTVVHEVDEDSPLFKYTEEEMQALNAELYILLEYYDEAFGQDVFKMHSYHFKQLILNKKFEPSFVYNEDGFLELDHHKLDAMVDV